MLPGMIVARVFKLANFWRLKGCVSGSAHLHHDMLDARLQIMRILPELLDSDSFYSPPAIAETCSDTALDAFKIRIDSTCTTRASIVLCPSSLI